MNFSSTRPRIVTIEGNIGAGKTTLINTLKSKYQSRNDVLFLEEPVDVWSTVKQDGKTMLELFYKDPKKYSFAFQIMAYNTRLKMLDTAICNANGIKLIIMERSLDADKNIFAKMLYDDGMMEDCMYQIYLQMSNEGMLKYMADGILWLDIDPNTCKKRIQQRNRDGEENISLDYLQKCDSYHQEWLSADTGFVFRIHDTPELESLERYLFQN
jgi:deoxyadenosine/deoxycytidine kinase